MTRRESTASEVAALDVPALMSHLESVISIDRSRVEIELLQGGRSNLTYRLSTPTEAWVVRRPPLGVVAPSANDVRREFTVLRALEQSAVPVPRALHLCEDASVIGAPFLVMSFVPGVAIRNEVDAARLDLAAPDYADALVRQLATLHAIEPSSVGLTEFGRTDGYLARQVARWGKQWSVVRTRDIGIVSELFEGLARIVPAERRSAIVHGDFRIDNVLFAPASPRITAVLDWEMSTLGDPLADVAMLLVYWDPTCAPLLSDGHPISGNPAFPSSEELMAMYVEATGGEAVDMSFYLALAYFKAAVIAEGIHRRYADGDSVGGDFSHVQDAVEPLAAAGLRSLEA